MTGVLETILGHNSPVVAHMKLKTSRNDLL